MDFDLGGKVALVTGGASGIGLSCARSLLKRGLKGVTIADVDEKSGSKALEDLTAEFGVEKCAFAKTDVTNRESFKGAFESTLQRFNAIDILINSAGICSDALWEKQIAININGTINGVLLGLEEYILKHKSGAEGVIVNVASVRGVLPAGDRPVYAATKFAVHGLTLAWGDKEHYERTKIKVMAVCPGLTDTPLIAKLQDTYLGPAYEEITKKNSVSIKLPRQSSQQCAERLVEALITGTTGSIWIIEGGDKYRYVMPDRFEVKERFNAS